MIYIGENIHIISKQVREALENKDEICVKNLVKFQENMDCIDLNVGPARGKLDSIFKWLCPLTGEKNISFDSTNIDAVEQGLSLVKNTENCFINSTSRDFEKLNRLVDLALEYNCNLIALATSKETGIPKTADGRLELVFDIYEKCLEKGLDSSKLFFDPLVLPVNVEQSQALEALSTLQMVKESFEPRVKTIIGLSNISNGLPKSIKPLMNRVFGVLAFGAGLDAVIMKESFEPRVKTIIGLSNISNGLPKSIKPLMNRVFGVLAFGAGLDAVIMDAGDLELVRIFKMLESETPDMPEDELYLNLSNMVKTFEDLSCIKFDKNSIKEQNIFKTAEILLNKKIYSDSFTQI